MMKEYKAPELEIVSFRTEDIIMESGMNELKTTIIAPDGKVVEVASLGSVNYNKIFND